MSNALEFGYFVGQHLLVKEAAGIGDFAKFLGRMTAGAAPAAKPAARAMTPPPLPVPPGMSRAGLERTTGRILDSSGRPVPQKAPPPVPAAPIRITAEDLQGLGDAMRQPPAPPVPPARTGLPANPLQAKPTAAGLQGLGGAMRQPPAPPVTRGRAGTAAPSWLRNNQAVQRGIDPSTGVRPGAVAPTPPPPSKITISPAEAAAGRPKITIRPEDLSR